MAELVGLIVAILVVVGGLTVVALSADEQTVTYINDTCVHIKEDKRSLFGEDQRYSTVYCETPISAQ